jgi:outer membrane receptor protein involved in Fe transport
MRLAITTPGVILGPKTSDTATPPGADFVGAGTREIQNSLSLDGISVMNNLITNTPTRVMVESVQEVEVQTGTYSAQYGAYLGVDINMVTKAGTNQFHGAAVEFLRNQVLDARTFFTLPTPANPTAKKPPLRQNQFGVEFDGPVRIPKLYNGRERTFFMASYEGYRLRQQSTSLSTRDAGFSSTAISRRCPHPLLQVVRSGSIEWQCAVSWQSHPKPGSRRSRRNSAVLPRAKSPRPGEQSFRSRAEHRQL